jgi:tetratricopeptide (TPR) repeat protein
MKTARRQLLAYALMLAGAALLSMFLYRQFNPEWVCFSKAEKLFVKRDFQAAMPFYRKALEQGLRVPVAYSRLIECGSSAGDPEGSVNVLRGVVRSSSDDRTARLSLARALGRADHTDEAILEYKTLLVENKVDRPGPAEDVKDPEEYVGKTEDIPDWVARWELSRLLGNAGRFVESVAEYEKLLAESPALHTARAEMATVLFWSGKPGEAIRQFERVPAQGLSYEQRTTMAEVYAALGDFGRAETIFRQCLRSKPGDFKVKLKLAESLAWAGKYDESLSEYRLYLKSKPGDVQARRKYAFTLIWAGKHGLAVDELRKSLGE